MTVVVLVETQNATKKILNSVQEWFHLKNLYSDDFQKRDFSPFDPKSPKKANKGISNNPFK